jgi:hypothetical protein
VTRTAPIVAIHPLCGGLSAGNPATDHRMGRRLCVTAFDSFANYFRHARW